MASNTKKHEKLKKTYCRKRIMARKLKNVENEKQTLQDLEFGEKYSKTYKILNAHCRTCSMVRNTENYEK